MSAEPIIAAAISAAATICAAMIKANRETTATVPPKHAESGTAARARRLIAWLVSYWRIGLLTMAFATLAFLGVWLAQRQDPGEASIRAFYKSARGDPNRAWALLHPERKAEIAKTIKSADDLDRAYRTTRAHTNVVVAFDKQEQDERLYWVSFDAIDTCVPNALYEALNVPILNAVEAGLINREKLIEIVLADIRRNYGGADQHRAEIEAWVLQRRLRFVLGPKFLTEIGYALNLTRSQAPGADSDTPVWTHFIQHIQMKKHDGTWCIRDGLHPPILEAPYAPNVQKPSLR